MSIAQVNAEDRRDAPLYSFSAAARHLGIPARTLRHWIVGRSRSRRSRTVPAKPLIRAPAGTGLISFNNLVEAHVLRAFRSEDAGRMAVTGTAIADAEKALGVDRLLLSDEMDPAGRDMILERLGELYEISHSVRLAIRRMLAASLQRLERDDDGLPVRLHPFAPRGVPDNRTIVLDPVTAAGRSTVAGSRVATARLAARVDAGDEVEALAAEYGLDVARVVDAVLYERAR